MTPPRIRVLHVLNTLRTGGAEHLVLNLAKSHDRERFELHVASLDGDGEIGDQLRAIGVVPAILQRRSGLSPGLLPQLVSLARAGAIDVVHTHNVAPWLYAGPAARVAGAALCHTEHSNLLPQQRGLRLAERVLARLTRAVICDGERVRRHLIDEQGLSPRNLITIHNGVDTAAGSAVPLAPAVRTARLRELGVPGAPVVPDAAATASAISAGPVIGTVARLEPVKDLARLLQAFVVVRARVPDATLIVVGDGSEREALQRQASAAGLGDRAVFLGRRSDVGALLPLFDVFALSSLNEGLPLTILEAMAAGLPCVATDVGAVAEAVLPGQTGLLVPPADVGALAAALLALVQDPARGKRLGACGQQRVRDNFDLRVMTRRYQDLWALSARPS